MCRQVTRHWSSRSACFKLATASFLLGCLPPVVCFELATVKFLLTSKYRTLTEWQIRIMDSGMYRQAGDHSGHDYPNSRSGYRIQDSGMRGKRRKEDRFVRYPGFGGPHAPFSGGLSPVSRGRSGCGPDPVPRAVVHRFYALPGVEELPCDVGHYTGSHRHPPLRGLPCVTPGFPGRHEETLAVLGLSGAFSVGRRPRERTRACRPDSQVPGSDVPFQRGGLPLRSFGRILGRSGLSRAPFTSLSGSNACHPPSYYSCVSQAGGRSRSRLLFRFRLTRTAYHTHQEVNPISGNFLPSPGVRILTFQTPRSGFGKKVLRNQVDRSEPSGNLGAQVEQRKEHNDGVQVQRTTQRRDDHPEHRG